MLSSAPMAGMGGKRTFSAKDVRRPLPGQATLVSANFIANPAMRCLKPAW